MQDSLVPPPLLLTTSSIKATSHLHCIAATVLHSYLLPLFLPQRVTSMLPTFQEWLAAAEADTALQPTSFPTPPPAASQLPVLVVGAGPGGLCAMAALIRRSVTCVCLEQHTGVGGIWDTASEHSSVYEGLSCNASRYSMTLDQPWDIPRAPNDALFPTERHMLAYLNHFADKHDIRQHCRFGCLVEQTAFDEQQQCWQVRYKLLATGEERTERFADVIAASGLNGRSSAHIPDELKAQCESAGLPYCHTATVKQPSSFAHKRVLVVGLGISGADMAAQLAQKAEKVFVSVRTPQYITPISLYGQPLDWIAGGDLPNVAALPRWLADAVLGAANGLLSRLQLAMTSPWLKHGLKRPDCSFLSKFPVADDGTFWAAVEQGKVELRNETQSFSAGKAHYIRDGATVNSVQSDDIDCVVFSTGYRFLHPYLPQPLALKPRRPVHIPTGRYPDAGQLTPHTLTTDTTFLLFSTRNSHLYFMTEVQAGFDWLVFRDQAATIVATILARRQHSDRIRRFNRVIAFPNVAFTGPLLGGEHKYRPNEEMVVEKSLYSNFLKQYVAWVEGEAKTVDSSVKKAGWL